MDSFQADWDNLCFHARDKAASIAKRAPEAVETIRKELREFIKRPVPDSIAEVSIRTFELQTLIVRWSALSDG